MFCHFDEAQWWGYYSQMNRNAGGLFRFRAFHEDVECLSNYINNFRDNYITLSDRAHWGELETNIPFRVLENFESYEFPWEVRCPDGLRIHKLGNKRVVSTFILLQSAHFLPFVEENHKCRRLHGHNFGLWLSVEISDFDLVGTNSIEIMYAISHEIKAELDRKILNDIDGLENPTSEFIAKWVYNKLQNSSLSVVSILCIETSNSAACYHGENLWSCWKSFDFESVWRPSYREYIGHSFRLSTAVTGELCPSKGWVMDFSEIKSIMKPLVTKLDHRDLSLVLDGQCNTSEGLLNWLSSSVSDIGNATYCLQSLPSIGVYKIGKGLDLYHAIPFLNWGI